ncbi:MAG: alpha/beta hydrolase [Anaerolineae bacterium]|nr:alpha/beta hydrolase [Anaerolineae bacterium]
MPNCLSVSQVAITDGLLTPRNTRDRPDAALRVVAERQVIGNSTAALPDRNLLFMTRFQFEEYLSLFSVFARVIWANCRPVATRRVPFGVHPQQYVLLCEPPTGVERRSTGIIFAHGGGWRLGNPLAFRFVGAFFAGLGFPTLLTGYRLAPAAKFPAQIDDVYAGCQAGIDALIDAGWAPTRWILGGQSAGAQLVALLAYADPARHEALLGHPAGLFLVSGPLDFSLCVTGDIARMIADLTGSEKGREAADPIRYVNGEENIPVLCIHGDRDPLVDPQNSRVFAEKAGPSTQVYIAKGRHHSDLAEIFIKPDLPFSKRLIEWLEVL